MKKLILFAILLLPNVAFAQNANDVWKPFRPFIGKWSGTSDGEPGKGRYERSYAFIFGEKYIEVRNKSVYPKQEKNPKGETHEDIGYISYDKNRKLFVLRQFHKEGYVNQYKLVSISPDGKTIVFESESIENIPTGWRSCETYTVHNNSEIDESFELAAPNADYKTYSKAMLKRKK